MLVKQYVASEPLMMMTVLLFDCVGSMNYHKCPDEINATGNWMQCVTKLCYSCCLESVRGRL